MRVMERIRGNRRLGFSLVLLGCVFLVIRGIHDEHVAMHSNDFLPVYSGARCMVEGMDPYNADALLQVNRSSGVNQDWARVILSYEEPVYPPTSLFLLTPLGAMKWASADRIWLLLEAISFSLATLLVWELCAEDAPVLAGVLLGAFMASSTLLMMTANPTALAVSLCAGSVWCALRQRWLWLGVICFALSLLLKPQVGGFVWLYFLLSAPVYRRFAWKVLAATVAMAVPAILWVSLMPASHHWLAELHSTLVTTMGPEGSAGPGINNPASFAYLNLQAIFAMVWGNPWFYELVTYAIAGPMILLWMWITVKSAPTRRMTYLGLATGVLLSLLPIYQMPYEVRLLLLIFPAAMLVWASRGRKGWLALGCVVGLTLISVNRLRHFLGAHGDAIYRGPLWLQLAGRPYAFVVLALAAIFLWTYVEAAQGTRAGVKEEDGATAPAE